MASRCPTPEQYFYFKNILDNDEINVVVADKLFNTKKIIFGFVPGADHSILCFFNILEYKNFNKF